MGFLRRGRRDLPRMTAIFDHRERGLHLLNRSPTLRPAMTRIAMAHLAEQLALADLEYLTNVFQHELDARRGRAKYQPTLLHASGSADTATAEG